MLQVETPIHPEMTQAERFFMIRQAYMKDRSQMTLLLAHKLQIPEVEIMRALEGDSAHELDFSCWEEIIRAFEELGSVHVILSNGAATIEVHGQFGRFTNADGFLNIRTQSLDMHIRSWELAAVFAFRKPSHLDGHESLSFQFFDRQGAAAFKVFINFGGRDPSTELIEKYEALITRFEK